VGRWGTGRGLAVSGAGGAACREGGRGEEPPKEEDRGGRRPKMEWRDGVEAAA
jgi:hypothetical protein